MERGRWGWVALAAFTFLVGLTVVGGWVIDMVAHALTGG